VTGGEIQGVESTPPEGPERFVSRAPKLGYAPPLDGMRGIGVMLVILVHAVFVPFASFALVVDMFFVVSGFLITTLLLEEDRRTGTVSLRRFYTRRALRLLPLLYLVLAGTLFAVWVVHMLFDDRVLLDRAISDVIAGGTYMYHVIHPVHVELVGGGDAVIRPLLQLWSLSVEEHFYIFGVLVILFVVKRRWITQLMVAFMVAYVFIGVARAMGHVGPNFAWYQRPDALLLGVTLAFVNARIPNVWAPTTERWMRRATTLATIGFVGVMFVGSWLARPFGIFVPFLVPEGGNVDEGLYWGRFGFTIASACVAVMVITFVRCPDHPVAKFLSKKVWTTVGVRSYGIYLIHVPLGVLMFETVGRRSEALALLLYLPILAGVSELAHRLVEKPAMRFKTRLAEPNASGHGVRDGT
jgi:peptidoglycan/LPS O-acetylase OafA/YrhL